jgi:hypothetical protein
VSDNLNEHEHEKWTNRTLYTGIQRLRHDIGHDVDTRLVVCCWWTTG